MLRQAPGGALSIKADRVVQTTISRLASGHTRGLSYHLGQKIYENCTKCNLVLATPDHLLLSAGLDREDIYSSPLLVKIETYSRSELVQIYTNSFSDEIILKGESGVHIVLLDNSTRQLRYGAGNIASNFTGKLNAIQEALKEYINLNDINKGKGLVNSKAALEAI
ncbi:hypothetical protein TNCV_835891 [Trichonephila clavipes]|nr:hypothetical protein TNCV_835891 [Trichonephila clavipes]